MKKFILLLAAVSAYCSASALELSFLLDNKKITPGTTVEWTDIKVVTYEDDQYKEVTMKPALYLTTDLYSSKIKVTAKCTSGQEIQMCADGKCRGGESVTQENITLQTNAKLDLGFDYVAELDLDEDIPTVTTEFEAEDVNKAGTKIQFVLQMGPKGASLTEITTSENIHAVEGALAYKAESPCILTVSTIGGVSVFCGEVEGEGTVTLSTGLYVYTFGNASGKIYIR